MIRRAIEATLHSLLRGFPVVTLTGPRQSGKTTLARSVFTDKPYLSLEDPDVSVPVYPVRLDGPTVLVQDVAVTSV